MRRTSSTASVMPVPGPNSVPHTQPNAATTSTTCSAHSSDPADPPAQLRAHRTLAYTYAMLGHLDDANVQLNHALDLAIETGDQAGQAHPHRLLSAVWERLGRPAQALDHAQRALNQYTAV